jgi:predicted transcriptional regulator
LSEKLIAIELGIGKTVVYGHIKRLVKNGYLRKGDIERVIDFLS